MASAVECTDYVREFVSIPWAGNASGYTAKARAAGWPISDTPVAGSIVCYQPGQDGAEWTGHVAMVIRVSGNTYVVSEMNRTGKSPDEVIIGGGSSGGPGIVDQRQVTFSPGVGEFIIPPAANVLPAMTQLLGGSVVTTAASSSTDTGGYTLAGAGAGLAAGAKSDASQSWGWVTKSALPLAVAGVMLWILFSRGGS